MSATTKIEWATKTWNPLRGCSKVSDGCRNCYAIRQAHRFSGPGMPYEGLTEKTAAGVNWTGKIRLVSEALDEPLYWNCKKPERVFVNSMSDLFHPAVPDKFIDQMFSIMYFVPWHTFIILTKRPERMLRYMTAPDRKKKIAAWIGTGGVYPARRGNDRRAQEMVWPLHNVWLGVSVEDQRAADKRIPLLLQTPAAVRLLSMEPMLGPVDLQYPEGSNPARWCCDGRECGCGGYPIDPPLIHHIDWVIVGGESGPNARPMHPDWVRSIRDQCVTAGVPFFFKQWGEWAPIPKEGVHVVGCTADGNFHYGPNPGVGLAMYRVGKKYAGRMLDGRTWDEYPDAKSFDPGSKKA